MIRIYKGLNTVNTTNLLSPLCVQLMHTNYYKIVKQLKSIKIIIVSPTCFGLRKPKHVGATIIILNDFNSLTIL